MGSGEMGECRCGWPVDVLARLEVRCAGFVDLVPELFFLAVCILMCASNGGLSRPCSCSIFEAWCHGEML